MSRRGNKEGSIHKRKDGRWACVADMGYSNGKRRRKYLYGKTRREVQERLTAVQHEIQRGIPVSSDRQTLAQFLAVWLESSVRPRVGPKTYVSYEQLVRLHTAPSLGRHSLRKLEPQHVQSWLNEKLSSGLSPRTVQYLRATLRNALNHAIRWGLVARNVAALADAPRVMRHEVQILDPGQARTFLEAAKGDRLEALYSVAVGLRQGEALGLGWSDVDLDRGLLFVRGSLQRLDGKLRIVEPKSRHSTIAINLPEVCRVALREHRVRQLEERLVAGSRWIDSGLVFTTSIGSPLEGTNVTRYFQTILERAGLPRIRFHDLRHTCASLLLAQGVQPRMVMETLGHSQISLTMNTYSHVMPAMRKDAADRMDAILSGNS